MHSRSVSTVRFLSSRTSRSSMLMSRSLFLQRLSVLAHEPARGENGRLGCRKAQRREALEIQARGLSLGQLETGVGAQLLGFDWPPRVSSICHEAGGYLY